jgi:serine/threonine-protein kinase
MGTVYLAVSRRPGGFVKLKVVKQLQPELARDPQFLRMFLEEARLAARLNHPNVVQTNEIGYDGAHHYIEMEYLEGQSYQVILRHSSAFGGIELGHSLSIFSQALAGLHYAHELTDLGGKSLGLVHRDVSPHNIFVTYEGVVKVLDFGIAKAADSPDTRSGALKGKVGYMAPEQASRGNVDRRADIFAVGVMLWQALAGRTLWSDLSEYEIFLRLAAGEIPRPSEIEPSVDGELESICMRALSVKPEDRFGTAREMQTAIDDWQERRDQRKNAASLGARVTELFGPRRAAVQAEIEAQLALDATSSRTTVDIPVLGTSEAYEATQTDRNAFTAEPRRPPSAAPTQIDPKTPAFHSARRSMKPVIAIGVFVAIGGAALGWATTRWTSPKAREGTASSVGPVVAASALASAAAPTPTFVARPDAPPSCAYARPGAGFDCGADGQHDCCASTLVPAGVFSRLNDPKYPAAVSEFRLDVYEVTVGRFHAFVEAGFGTREHPPEAGAGAHPRIRGSGWDSAWNAKLEPTPDSFEHRLSSCTFLERGTFNSGEPTLPMTCINWLEAFAFCTWDGGRLPTEAELTYAAAGGSEQRAYPWSAPGSPPTISTDLALYCPNGVPSSDKSNFICPTFPPPAYGGVGLHSPNGDGRWGHADLAGSAWELVLDWFKPLVPNETCVDCAQVEKGNATLRMMRGGGIWTPASQLRVSNRGVGIPPDFSTALAGVRCARSP